MHILRFIGLGIFLIASVCSGESRNTSKIALVKNGVVKGQIVISAAASDAEKFASEELQHYINKITGATLPIVATNNIGDKPSIIVGRHQAAKEIIAELNRRYPNKYDAIAVVARGNKLFVAGRCETGTVWAGWDWLESLGVEWLFPGELGEYVPKMKNIYILSSEKYDAPRLDYRGPCGGDVLKLENKNASFKERKSIATNLFLMRMRRNYAFAGLSPRKKYDPKWNWVRKDRAYYIDGGHTYKIFLPPSKYYKRHPEWFRFFNGKRQNGSAAQVCYTNREAANEFAKNLLVRAKFIIEKCGIPPERVLLVASPNDCRPARCECKECMKLLDKKKSASSQVTFFANRIAAIVRKVYPDVRVVFYAYDDYSFPPEHVKPAPGVCPRLAFWVWSGSFGANHTKPMFSMGNRRYHDAFIGWAKISDQVFSRVYYGHYNWFTPWPKITQMSYDIKNMTEQVPNFQGMWSETYFHWGTQGLNFYIYSKLMWNPQIDVHKTISDYCKKAFGPAGPAIRKYFSILQKQMDTRDYICCYTVEIPKLLSPKVILDCNMYIDKAEHYLDRMDDGTRWRTELVIKAWRASAQFGEAVNLFVSRKPKPGDRERILTLCDEVDKFADTELGQWAFCRGVAKGSIRRIVKPLKLDLENIPPGKHRWSEGFHQGGAVKFYADYKGFRCGMWGYTIGPGGKGVMSLPIRAAKGAKIVSAKMRWGFDPGKFFKARVSAVDKNGKEHILAPTLDAVRKGVTIPDEFLGSNSLLIRLSVVNPRDSKGKVYLTGGSLNVTVR